MLRIIDNKQVELTDSEYQLYQDICKSYDSLTFKGEFLFKDLFEVNEYGLIIFLKPPKTTFSFEVVIFLTNLMIHQHLRFSINKMDACSAETVKFLNESKNLEDRIKIIENKLIEIENNRVMNNF